MGKLQELSVLPERLDRRTQRAALGGVAARRLEYVDVDRPGAAIRAAGCVRPDFATGESTTVLSAGTFIDRAGRKVLIWATAGGAWKLQGHPTAVRG
ncbi:MAG: hypothetical protein M5U26_03530 [Planctomycetota bacterium]|nr:hypothetical protein [Planctomycetota bacterium]